MNEGKESVDKVLTITPRTAIMLAGTVVAVYASIFATFATTGSVEAVEQKLNYHLVEARVLYLQDNIRSTSDLRWDLQDKIEQPGGDTADRRKRISELETREVNFREQIACYRAGGEHCEGD